MSSSYKAEQGISRRAFVKGAGVAGAGMLAAGAATPARAAALAAQVPEEWDYDVDVLVAGAGNGGLSAALAAADLGANTLLIEISSVTGGNSLYAGGLNVPGYLHSYGQRTWEDYNAYTRGLHDQVLARVFVETLWDEYIPWLLEKGAHMTRPTPDGPTLNGDWRLGDISEPGKLSNRRYFDSLEQAFKDAGGTLLLKTRALKLYMDDAGAVIGLQAQTWTESPLEPNQQLINIRAKKTILCTGNWYQNREMATKYIGRYAYRALSWGAPYQTGEGVKMAEAAGAMMSKFLDTWSGGVHVITPQKQFADDPEAYERFLAEVPPEEYSEHIGSGSPDCPSAPFNISGPSANAIVVNLDGKRFYDESNGAVANQRRNTFFILQQPQGEAWVIADQAAFEAGGETAQAQMDILEEKGANVIVADTLEELADALEVQGMYKAALLKTIADYNQAIDDGATLELDPPRTAQETFFKIEQGPFYAVPVTASFYYTAGGLAINEDAQTLDYQHQPIPNLYSPPPLGGGIMNQVYMGAVAAAGTFGFRAARHAVANLES